MEMVITINEWGDTVHVRDEIAGGPEDKSEIEIFGSGHEYEAILIHKSLIPQLIEMLAAFRLKPEDGNQP